MDGVNLTSLTLRSRPSLEVTFPYAWQNEQEIQHTAHTLKPISMGFFHQPGGLDRSKHGSVLVPVDEGFAVAIRFNIDVNDRIFPDWRSEAGRSRRKIQEKEIEDAGGTGGRFERGAGDCIETREAS